MEYKTREAATSRRRDTLAGQSNGERITTMTRYRSSWSAAGIVSVSLLVVSVLPGCGVANIAGDYSLDERKGTGVAIVSLVQSGLPGGYRIAVHLRGVDNIYDNSVPLSQGGISMDWGCPLLAVTSETAPCGRLAIIELPRGEYEFYSWSATMGGAGTIEIHPTNRFSKRFKVLAGKAAYLGNIQIVIKSGFLSGSYGVKITDMRQRDLPLFYQKHPNINTESVVVSILPE